MRFGTPEIFYDGDSTADPYTEWNVEPAHLEPAYDSLVEAWSLIHEQLDERGNP